MMTLPISTLIIAALATVAASVAWTRCRKLTEDLKNTTHQLDAALREKEDLIGKNNDTNVHRGAGESTILALAGEISRIESNLAHMDDVPGRKQLLKCVERMKMYLQAENYNIVPLLGARYTDGMMVSAAFVHDGQIPRGEAKIISVQLPQVNYCGKMIQCAKVTVGENIE